MIIALLIQTIVAAGIYFLLGKTALQDAAVPRILAALAPFLLFPVLWFWKFWSIPPLLAKENADRVLELRQAYDALTESHKPRIEITGLFQDQADSNRRWFLQVHNRSKTESIPKCGAMIEEVVTVEGDQVPGHLTLGTKNQWDQKREQGRFHMDPDGTKHLVICEPVGNAAFSCRLLFAQDSSRKLARGKYRLKIRIAAPQGEPVLASVLINQFSVQLEAMPSA